METAPVIRFGPPLSVRVSALVVKPPVPAGSLRVTVTDDDGRVARGGRDGGDRIDGDGARRAGPGRRRCRGASRAGARAGRW